MKKLEQTDQHVNEEHEIAKVDVDNLFKRAKRQFWERIVDGNSDSTNRKTVNEENKIHFL